MHRNEDGEVEKAEGGQDCTSLRNVKGVECYDSKCLISEYLTSSSHLIRSRTCSLFEKRLKQEGFPNGIEK